MEIWDLGVCAEVGVPVAVMAGLFLVLIQQQGQA